MNPQNQQKPDDRALRIPQRQFADPQSRAAAEVVRQQIDRIYDTAPPNQTNQAPAAQPAATEQTTPENPYERTHKENFDWRTYHTAWQQYYQQYYQKYYWQQLHSERQKLAATAADKAIAGEKIQVGGDPTIKPQASVEALKTDITKKVKQRADKVRKSHHFVPLISAAAVGLVFLFLQFNSVIFAQVQSYISPGAISNDSITIDPSVAVNVGPDPKLIIPKINVEVPVDYSIATTNEQSIQVSLRDGATHYKLPGADATPGQNGNTVILGHSSNDVFNQGAYKFVFVLLDRLQAGDVFYLHYNGTRYIYRVTEIKVIDPSDIAALQIGTDKPMATLITCTPPGTALKRLLIIGEQISPDPAGSKPAETTTPAAPTDKTTVIAGNEPSILDQIWNYFF